MAGLSAAAAVLSECAHLPAGLGDQTDVLRRENARPATRDWLLQNTRVDPATKYRCPGIEGYCSRTSVRVGEQISFHISTNPASQFTLAIYRLGYSGGAGGRHVARLGGFSGEIHGIRRSIPTGCAIVSGRLARSSKCHATG